jgi:L-cysteine/cystine lyase
MLDVTAIRKDIPSLDKSIYLNTGGVAPIPRPVYEVLIREFTERYIEGSPDILRPVSVQQEESRVRKEMARFLGVEPSEICFTRGVSDGASIAMNGFRWQPGDEIVTTNEEHCAFYLSILLLKKRFGVVVRMLELENDGDVILERFQRLLSPHTRLVALSHVTTDNGIRLPVQAMSASAHEAGVPVLLDGAQSLGQFPVNVKETGCDLYSVLSYKWLLGPYSAGVLYISNDWADRLEVTATGARAERALNYAAGTFELARGAQRFEFGPRVLPVCLGMVEAVHYLEEIGLGEIERQVQGQAEYLRQGLRAIPGVTLRSPEQPDQGTGIVTFSIQGLPGRDISQAFRTRWNIVTRPTGLRFDAVRVSVAFFTTREELDAVLEAVGTLVRAA